MAREGLPPENRLPRHLAIIMDGNGRWARRRGMPRVEGHRKGAEALRRTTRACAEFGIPFLSVYAFSVDNRRRPKKEVSFLMRLLARYLKGELDELLANDVRLNAVGLTRELPAYVREALEKAVRATSSCRGLTLTLALNYSGRLEVIEAAKKLARKARKGPLKGADTSPDGFRRFLWTGDLPPVDLLIRTAGEQRLSDFILYDSAYAELHFTDVLWPDFGEEDLRKALWDFAGRERRFGGLSGEE